jgi:hypothetical protein
MLDDPAQPTLPSGVPAPVHTSSRHEVKTWIENQIKAGRLRDCVNLYTQDYRAFDKGLDGDQSHVFFLPQCRQQSFISNYRDLSEEAQVRSLQYSLQNNPLSCPKDCTFYRSRQWNDFKRTAKKPFREVFEWMLVALKTYGHLPWQTQCVIALGLAFAVILWKAPQWVPAIVALAQALRGK